MRTIALACLMVLLAACSSDSVPVGAPLAADRAAADDATCRQDGFTPGTEDFANCRLQLGQKRAADAAASAQSDK